MASQTQHLAQARRNEDLYHHLALVTPAFIDWQITALFYAALHYVDAYLAGSQIHPHNHGQRESWMTMVSDLTPIYRAYDDLRNYSHTARYELTPFRPGYEQTLYNGQFTAIRIHITALLP